MNDRAAQACPPEDVWDSIAAGALAEREALDWLEHAGVCSSCARLLRDAVEVFAAETPPVGQPEPGTRFLLIAAAGNRKLR